MSLRSRMHPSQKHFAARTVSQTKVASMKPSTLFIEFWKGIDSIYKPFSREHSQLMLGREKESDESDDCESPPANPLSSMECLLSCLLVPEGDCERKWRRLQVDEEMIKPSKRLRRIESDESVISRAIQHDLVILDECVEEELQSLGMVEPCSKLSACRPNGSIDHELLVLVDDGKLLSSVESVAQRVSERIASPLQFLLLSLSGGTGDGQRDEER